jgi:hypothetical protein
MFSNIGKVAEQVAIGASRREFFRSLSHWAGATALAVAGVLTTARTARAGSCKTCCYYGPYELPYCGIVCVPAGHLCPATPPKSCSFNAVLMSITSVESCSQCK